MPTAAILIVGDEILSGHTQDTNSHYLARRLDERGIRLRHIVTVPDEVPEIAQDIQGLLGRGLDLVFVCGGIGPTPDDRTYEAVARATGRPLTLTEEDRSWIERRVIGRGYGKGLLDDPAQAEALLRMVRRPEGSLAIENPVGAALGSVVTSGGCRIFVLPGVPRELRAMMEQVIEVKFLGPAASVETVGELELHGEEARLFAVMTQIEREFPGLRIGSYPQDDRGRILVRARGAAADVEAALARLQATVRGPTRRLR